MTPIEHEALVSAALAIRSSVEALLSLLVLLDPDASTPVLLDPDASTPEAADGDGSDDTTTPPTINFLGDSHFYVHGDDDHGGQEAGPDSDSRRDGGRLHQRRQGAGD